MRANRSTPWGFQLLLRLREAKRFLKEFIYIFLLTRGVLLFILTLILLGAFIFSLIEKISFSQSVYFAFITGMTIGYGDITPTTGLGQVISVLLGVIGVTFFGLMIAIATSALRVTLRESRGEK